MQKYHVVQELALKSAGSKMSSTMTLSSTSSSSVLDSSAVVFSPVHQQPPFIKGGALKDYQIKGINRLLYQRSKNISNVVADEIGLGKTVQLGKKEKKSIVSIF